MQSDLSAPSYKTRFAAQLTAIEPSDDQMLEARASLSDLKTLLPEGVNPEDDPQLLYIAANLYVGGMVNLNDDGVDIETALATYKKFEKQQLNIEHDRDRVAGYILSAGLSEWGTDRILTEDEVRAAGRPFNVAIAAVLWKVNNPKLCAYLREASSPLHPDFKSLSLSFEVGFSSYNIAVIDSTTRVISEASHIYKPEDPEFSVMAAKLRANGGSGRAAIDSTEGVYQILTGTFLPLGGGIVAAPAAAVRGIVAITEPVEHKIDDETTAIEPSSTITPQVQEPGDVAPVIVAMHETDDKLENAVEALAAALDMQTIKDMIERFASRQKNNSLFRIKSTQTRVSSSTSNPISISNMSKELLEQIKQKAASVEKPEDVKQVIAGVLEIADAISAQSEKLSADLLAEQNRAAEIEKNRAEAAAASESLKVTLETVKNELAALRAEQSALAAAAAFDERMATIDEEFELDDDERALIIEDVKSLDDKGFDGWMTKAKKMMKEKTKLFKKKVKDDKSQKQDQLKAALAAKGITLTMDENELIKEVIASAQANNVSDPIVNTLDVSTKTLKERVEEEFKANASIGGKKLSEFGKK